MPRSVDELRLLANSFWTRGFREQRVTRSDLADPAPAAARAEAEVGRTSLAGAPVVAVSSRTGAGLEELRARLSAMVQALPDPDPRQDVRLWVDRRFTVSGAGTVVTGTLPAGTIALGDTLSCGAGTLRVRGVQSLGAAEASVSGVARVALNVTGDLEELDRSGVLTTPGAYRLAENVDVRIRGDVEGLPTLPMLHIGALAMTARCRPLAGDLVRLTLERPLPLRVGDRALLRDPGSRRVWGVQVLDPLPPPLRRRGAAAHRAAVLAPLSGDPDLASEVERREVVDLATLRRLGVPTSSLPSATASSTPPPAMVAAGQWLMSSERADRAAREVLEAVTEHDRARPLEPGLPLTALAERLGMPSPELVAAVVREPLRLEAGLVRATRGDVLPPEVEQALVALADDLEVSPLAAPTADRLRELGLDPQRVAAAAKAGRVLRLAPGVILLPGADRVALERLRDLPQPFTASEARARLATSRRVVLPLLEHLDRAGLTRRLPDDRRTVAEGRGTPGGVPSRT